MNRIGFLLHKNKLNMFPLKKIQADHSEQLNPEKGIQIERRSVNPLFCTPRIPFNPSVPLVGSNLKRIQQVDVLCFHPNRLGLIGRGRCARESENAVQRSRFFQLTAAPRFPCQRPGPGQNPPPRTPSSRPSLAAAPRHVMPEPNPAVD